MGDLSKNISRFEIRCRCNICGLDSIDIETIKVVQAACNNFGKIKGRRSILDINSGFRCYHHNIAVGGNPDSQHLFGRAIDHSIRGVSNEELADYYRDMFFGKYGIGEYPTFVHLDTRTDGPARW